MNERREEVMQKYSQKMSDAEKLEFLAEWFDLQYPNDPEPEIQNDLRTIAQDLRKRGAEIERLKAWKESQLAVESSWDCQAVAKAMDIPLGSDIRKEILPYILKQKARIEELKEGLGAAIIWVETGSNFASETSMLNWTKKILKGSNEDKKEKM